MRPNLHTATLIGFISLLLSSCTATCPNLSRPLTRNDRFVYDRMATTGMQERVFDLASARWVTVKLSPSSNQQAAVDLDRLDFQFLSAMGSPPDVFPLVVEGTLLPEVHWTGDPAHPRPDEPTPEPYQELILDDWWIGMPLVSYPFVTPLSDEKESSPKVIHSLSEIGLHDLIRHERRSE